MCRWYPLVAVVALWLGCEFTEGQDSSQPILCIHGMKVIRVQDVCSPEISKIINYSYIL